MAHTVRQAMLKPARQRLAMCRSSPEKQTVAMQAALSQSISCSSLVSLRLGLEHRCSRQHISKPAAERAQARRASAAACAHPPAGVP